MTQGLALDLARDALLQAVMMASPLLVAAIVVGVLVSVVQAITQVQEQTLSFVPKLFAVAVVFFLSLSWMLTSMVEYTTKILRSFPGMVS